MKIESIEIKNFKVFQNAKISNLPNMAVLIGKNGTGKTIFFDILAFLQDCLKDNVSKALAKRGGFREVVSQGHEDEDISLIFKFKQKPNEPIIIYKLSISLNKNNFAVLNYEIISLQSSANQDPWIILKFVKGLGFVEEYEEQEEGINTVKRREYELESPDILALKGLGQFKDFVVVADLRKFIEDWSFLDFSIEVAKELKKACLGGFLTPRADNLLQVVKDICDHYPKLFKEIMVKIRQNFKEIENVEILETLDGYLRCPFKESTLSHFGAKRVSDGTLKLFMYLVLLHNPWRKALLSLEAPEEHLYPELLEKLAQEFQSYSFKGQVFISTYSPTFLNAVPLNAIYVLKKQDGFTLISRIIDLPLVKSLGEAGDLPGSLWREGLL
ncbi:MAG: AAA family ATPase [Desulfovibrionaceae bacterium]|nr:AAA family ATPase [Desulfovibrionaceae bacterium]